MHHRLEGRTKARGEIRDQYHHAIDIVPTILDVLGVDAPETIKGHVQTLLDGVSMRASIDDASAPSGRKTQFYAMLGSTSIWHEGWKAVTNHPTLAGWGHFNDDEWELYQTMSTRPSCGTWPPSDRRRSENWSTSGFRKPARTVRSHSMTDRQLRS